MYSAWTSLNSFADCLCDISDFYNLKLPGLRPGFCNNNNTAADGGDHTEAITRELKDFGFEEPRTPPLGHPLFDKRRKMTNSSSPPSPMFEVL